jgi:hypothetical protein
VGMALLATLEVVGGLASSPQPGNAMASASSKEIRMARITILAWDAAYCCDHTVRQRRQRLEGIAGQRGGQPGTVQEPVTPQILREILWEILWLR